MSRKDYIEAARILSETEIPAEVRSQLVARFVTMFADDNARFSPSKFRAACEPQDQPCRGCGETFPYDPDADFCPSCAAENAGEGPSSWLAVVPRCRTCKRRSAASCARGLCLVCWDEEAQR